MNTHKPKGRLLKVQGIKPGEVVYNPSVIIQKNTNKIANGAPIIAVRVESLHSHWLDPNLYDPHVIFFTLQNDALIPIPNAPIFYGLEDPWATWLVDTNGKLQLLFGGVKVEYKDKTPFITTQMYLAPSVQELDTAHPVLRIIDMKDVRITQLQSGKIAVFTRPMTGDAFPGRIGFEIVDTIHDIEKVITSAKLLKFNLGKNEKMGANEAYTITKRDSTSLVTEFIHVFCHVATTDLDGSMHYIGYEFELNPEKPHDNIIELHKVADRSDFPLNDLHSKAKIFDDVVFPGGTGGAEATQYFAGVEDARVGIIDIDNV